MSFLSYIKDKILMLLLEIICMFGLGIFLHLTGYSIAKFWVIMIVWFSIVFFWMIINWLNRRAYFQQSAKILEELDQRYLLGELLPKSWYLEDKMYPEMMRKS